MDSAGDKEYSVRMLTSLRQTLIPMLAGLTLALAISPIAAPAGSPAPHVFSTLFTAHDVRNLLSDEAGLQQAIDWCRATRVTKVYVESFRDGYRAEKAALEKARDQFREAGLEVSGCVTPTKVGKASTGWDLISCYTDIQTQEKIRDIFDYTARIFDEIMIDDFWFTDCACAECETARKARQVTVGGKNYRVNGDTWPDYRCELMVQVSREHVLATARKANPKTRLIIKYPQWYDNFHVRGYDVIRQTKDFHRTWVGTETRDYQDARWGGTVQYEACFIMRWLGGIGGKKCGGGWYDSLGTTANTYVEQARQTILAGADESMLFAYGGLQRDPGKADVEALRRNQPELLRVAGEVQKREVIGIAAYKPPGSSPEGEPRVFDFVGMLGFPLVPCHEFPIKAKAAFFSMHTLSDPKFRDRFERFVKAGKPALITDGLASQLSDNECLKAPNVHVIEVRKDPKTLLQIPEAKLGPLRQALLEPFRVNFEAPSQVALYLFKDGSYVIENFNDAPVRVRYQSAEMPIGARDWEFSWVGSNWRN